MDCEGKYAYEGLGLGIWKVIGVIWNVKKIILIKKLFLDLYGWCIGATNGDFRRRMTF
jgi:hypothetical protein